MKEQIQTPFDSRGTEKEEEESRPKGLDKPVMPKGLEKPKVKEGFGGTATWFRRRCSCGNWFCNSPVYDTSWHWEYFDVNGKRLEGPEFPRNGEPENSASVGIPMFATGDWEMREARR